MLHKAALPTPQDSGASLDLAEKMLLGTIQTVPVG